VVWAGDPRQGTALLLARFPARNLAAVLELGAAWAQRYDEVAVGEAASPGQDRPNVLAIWRRGKRQAT
jgi:hypothetical protein